jgi:hypothetical protein
MPQRTEPGKLGHYPFWGSGCISCENPRRLVTRSGQPDRTSTKLIREPEDCPFATPVNREVDRTLFPSARQERTPARWRELAVRSCRCSCYRARPRRRLPTATFRAPWRTESGCL